MSLAIGVETKDRVLMGADSAVGILGSPGEIYSLRHLEKIVRCGPYLLGYCDNARVGQVLVHHLSWPEPPDSQPLTSFLIRELVPEIRRTLQDADAAQEGRTILGPDTVLLVAARGELYTINADLTVVRSEGLVCIGCGRHAAYPVMDALQAAGVESARQRIEMTLEIVAGRSPLVRPPFRFLEL
jgi:20S proteasome alpha/beta subunit